MNWMAAARLLLIFALATPAIASPQIPGGLGGVFKKKEKPKEQKPAPEQKKDEEKKADDNKLLFADDGAKSTQKKDTTAMGFSGLNPDGTVENAVLNASPTAQDEAAAAALGRTRLAPGELQQFLSEGSLKAKGGQ